MFDPFPTKTGIEEADTGFDTTPVTATVSPTLAPAPATVETGFGELDETPAAVQQAIPTVNTVADTGKPEDLDADLDARVAALLPNNSITDWSAVSAFMGLVVPWPGSPTDLGWVVLPTGYLSKKSPDGRDPESGKYPIGDGLYFKTHPSLIQYVQQNTNSLRVKDIFFGLSLQRNLKQDKRQPGVLRAQRTKANAMSAKALWLDVDVGKDGTYATVEEALKAVITFTETVGLPPFSAIVGSGGGIHVYWISDKALAPNDWRPYAEGLKALAVQQELKCDLGVTTDISRMLRMPGTFNYKSSTPRPVQLFNVPLVMYDFPTALAALPPLASVAKPAPAARPTHPLFADGATMANFHQPAPWTINEPDLDAGIKKSADAMLDPKPIFTRCGFLREALVTGGRDYDEPLWNQSVLCATFMKNGRDIAHLISKGHPSYSEAGTEAKFDLKIAAGIGYPYCATIASAGCKACATCPLFPEGKSPLNIRPDAPEFTATVNPAAGDAPQADPSFVDPYAEFVGPEFPLEILPPTLAAFVAAEHRAMGADPAAIAMAALTVVAGAMHAETRVRVGEGWSEKPIIWTALLGQPSTMKSPIIDKSTKPLSLINHECDNRWRTEQTKWAQSPDKKTIPSPLKPARSVINDATAEKVAELLSRDPRGSLMVQDELAGWLGGFERYNTGQSSRAFYLSAWHGGPFLKDRVGKGKNDPDAEIRVENLALSVLGGIQPDRLAKLDDLTSDGLLQRFVPVLMKPAKLGDPYYPVAGAEVEYEKLIKSVHALPAQNYHFTDEAFEVRDEVLSYLHSLELVDGFPPSLIGAIGKLNGYFARFCLVLHVARQHDPMIGNTGPSEPLHSSFTGDAGERLRKLFGLPQNDCLSAGITTSSAISGGTAEAAKKMLLEFLLPHMIGLYDVVVNGGQERDKLRSIANFILASDKDRLRPSDFTGGVRSLRGAPDQKIREWVGRFCSMDWLSPEEGKPGVPAKAWLVSPGLRQCFAGRRKQVQAANAEMHAIMKAGGSSKSR